MYFSGHFSTLIYEIKQPIYSKGLHPPHPLLHIWFKTSCAPQTPCFRDHLYIQTPSKKILDPPLILVATVHTEWRQGSI